MTTSAARSGLALALRSILVSNHYRILDPRQAGKRDGITITLARPHEACITFDYAGYVHGHLVMFNRLVDLLRSLGYVVDVRREPEPWRAYVTYPDPPTRAITVRGPHGRG